MPKMKHKLTVKKRAKKNKRSKEISKRTAAELRRRKRGVLGTYLLPEELL